MDIRENLYTTVMEECAEVQQAISKILRFGEDNYAPNGSPAHNNERHLLTEYYQLQTVMEMLFEKNIITDLSTDEILQIKADKKKKIISYQTASKFAGYLQTEDMPEEKKLNPVRHRIISNVTESLKQYPHYKHEDMVDFSVCAEYFSESDDKPDFHELIVTVNKNWLFNYMKKSGIQFPRRYLINANTSNAYESIQWFNEANHNHMIADIAFN